jgi:hypothetical protein
MAQLTASLVEVWSTLGLPFFVPGEAVTAARAGRGRKNLCRSIAGGPLDTFGHKLATARQTLATDRA